MLLAMLFVCPACCSLVFLVLFVIVFLVVVEQHDVYGPYAALECSRFLPLLYSCKGALLCAHGVDGELLHACQPFDAQNIHGVREVCCTGDVVELLTFSDKYIRHMQVQYNGGEGVVSVQIVNRFKLFDDFIWDCALVNDKQQLVVGLAHNRVQLYTIREPHDSDGGLELVGDVRCTPQCVLYCMNLCTANSGAASNANSRMLIASGTCFHDVTLWYMSDNAAADAEVKCTLKGHKGVVFRMKFCEATMTLLTVSDDRCVVRTCASFALTADQWEFIHWRSIRLTGLRDFGAWRTDENWRCSGATQIACGMRYSAASTS
jgi:hypothetical protein